MEECGNRFGGGNFFTDQLPDGLDSTRRREFTQVKESKPPRSASPSGTETAERVADILLALMNAENTIGVTAIARQLNLSKAVVHRILQSLVSRGLARFDAEARSYGLGPYAFALGARALRQLDLRVLARNELVALRDLTLETTTLSILVVDKRTYVDQYESPNEIKMTVELGRLYPLYAGASGRSILAFLPSVEVERILAGELVSLTDETIDNTAALRSSLLEVRDKGYAVSRGERQHGAGSIAAPVFRGHGEVVGAISVCGPINRFSTSNVNKYIPLVTSAAAEISERLGA